MHKNVIPVSVIIPCYKSIETIERAVHSVSRQTNIPSEVILVDDNSPDNTLSFLYQIKNKYIDLNIVVIPLEHNSGAGSARNAGWNVAKFDYIAFLDSDDSWHVEKLKIQYTYMLNNPNVTLTGHDYLQVSADDFKELIENDCLNEGFKRISKAQLLMSNRFSTPSVMLKRKISFRFNEGQRYSEDYHLWLEIMLAGFECYKSDLKLTYIYKGIYGDSGLSADLWKMQKGEFFNYKDLFKRGSLSCYWIPFLYVYSFLKFLKRIFVFYFNK